MNGTRCCPAMSALRDGDRQVTDDREKADLFAKQFAKVSCSLNYSDEFRERKLDVETNRPELFANDAPVTAMTEKLNVEFSLGELERAIGQTRRVTATGEDRVAADFWPTCRRRPGGSFYGYSIRYGQTVSYRACGSVPSSYRY